MPKAFTIIGPKFYGFLNDGTPAAGYKLYAWEAGASTTPKKTWKDENKAVENTHPIVLSASGNADVVLEGVYRLELYDPTDTNLIWREDPYTDPSQAAGQEWVDEKEASFFSATEFEIIGDFTADFDIGRRVLMSDVSTLYGTITSVQYISGNTRVEMAMDTGSITGALTTVKRGFLSGGSKALPNNIYIERGTIDKAKDHGTVTSGTVLIDADDGYTHKIKTGGDFTLAFPTNIPAGKVAHIKIILENATQGDITLDDQYDLRGFNGFGISYNLVELIFVDGVVAFQRLVRDAAGVFATRKVITASDAAAGDGFGVSVALNADGTVMAVGAYFRDGAAGADQGAVYVFDWSGSAWVERTTALVASDAGAIDRFGGSVALSGDATVMAVGAYLWDGAAGADQGAVYVFDWSGSAWVERTTALVASDAGAGDEFGISVDLSADGTIMAVGAPDWDGVAGADQGAVYVFDWNGSAWVERTTALVASDAGANDNFGTSVALSADGTILAVGAPGWDGPSAEQGCFYVYDWNGSAWVERSDLIYETDLRYGYGLCLSSDGTILAVGEHLAEGPTGVTNEGAAHFYDRVGSAWVKRQDVIYSPVPQESAQFGRSVSMNDNATILALGTGKLNGVAGTDQGAAFVMDAY